MSETKTTLVQTKKGVRGGTARRTKQHAAESGNIRPGSKKVRTRAVQDKKDRNVFRHSGGHYKTVEEMQKAGKDKTSNTADKNGARKHPNDV